MEESNMLVNRGNIEDIRCSLNLHDYKISELIVELAYEKRNKNRKTVISMIKSRIRKISRKRQNVVKMNKYRIGIEAHNKSFDYHSRIYEIEAGTKRSAWAKARIKILMELQWDSWKTRIISSEQLNTTEK